MTKTDIKRHLTEIEKSHNYEFTAPFQTILNSLQELNEFYKWTDNIIDFITDQAITRGFIKPVEDLDSF